MINRFTVKTVIWDLGPWYNRALFCKTIQTVSENSELVCCLSTSHHFEEFQIFSKPVTPEPEFSHVMRLWMYDSAL